MHLFNDYIQPLSLWLYTHPNWALFITFLISFSESLAIIGTIIPGSVTMTAIGILAGSGVLRIDLTYLAATLGAIAGDGGSYALGAIFSDRINTMWPFSKYPKWLIYGRDFFEQHGRSSVFIGRFFGPMRSIIPVVAGMMHMNHWQFFIANTLSAIGWAILYVTPGVLIGAASTELPPDAASRLCLFILLLIAMIWLTSLGIKSLFIYSKHILRIHLNNFWLSLKHHPQLSFIAQRITPSDELNHYPTAILTLSCLFFFIMSLLIVELVLLDSPVDQLDLAAYQFFLSLRTQAFDVLFIIISLAISPLPVLTLITGSLLYAIYDQNYRPLKYWLSLLMSCGLAVFLLTYIADINTLNPLTLTVLSPFFPDLNLTIATATYGFLIFFMGDNYRSNVIASLRILFITILVFGGLARLYLGDNLLTSIVAAYSIGLFLCILHWIIYRLRRSNPSRPQQLVYLLCMLVILASCVTNFLYYKKMFREHHQQLPQYVLTEKAWWNQTQPILPIYSTNRFGQHIGFLNIQYLGSIKKLQDTLVHEGWKKHPDSFFYTLILRAGGQNHHVPLITQLVQNKKPCLMMSYSTANNESQLILRLWRSNYHLNNNRQPIWIGSVSPLLQKTSKNTNGRVSQKPIAAYKYLKQALHKFKLNQTTIPKHYLQTLPQPTSSVLLIIKESNVKVPEHLT